MRVKFHRGSRIKAEKMTSKAEGEVTVGTFEYTSDTYGALLIY